jgi:small subunit ribosomal protein S12e
MSEQQQEANVQQEEENKTMTLNEAIEKALKIALTRGSVVKGISEVCKALECQKVKMVFLASDCDNDDYKNLVKGLAKQFNVKVVEIDQWVNLKDYCQIGLLSANIKDAATKKGKEAKIKPRCSSAAILEWGEDSQAKKFLEEYKAE